MATTCHGCGAELRIEGVVGRRATCPACDAELHTCLHCRHFEPSAAHGCREPHAERIADPEAANACDLFQLGDGGARRRAPARGARDALAALFGEAPSPRAGEAPAAAPDPRDALEALFRKKDG
jgi:hypothetical protein